MPLYEYLCTDCGAHLEFVVAGTEPRTCGAKCTIRPGVKTYGGGPLVRQMSAPAVVRTSAGVTHAPDSVEDAARRGFTTYERAGDGTYKRVAGEGPDKLPKKPMP